MAKKYQKPELLAPAGDLEKMKCAFLFGADAVYLGLPNFSLRAKTGFDLKSLKVGVEYAHKLKKKVYVTINVFAHNSHLKKIPSHLSALKKINPDAVIVSDPGVLFLVKKYLPKTEIHLSTQANVLNYEAVRFWGKQGVKRIILGREASLADIKEISNQTSSVGLEAFVHGAMCMSYSGRCYLSAWLNDRSANEGLCTQPCRWQYKVYLEEGLRPAQMIPIESDEQGTYILNSKDLCLVEYLDQLAAAGISSFKVEGRTKSIYYLAIVVRVYRQLLDGKMSLAEAKKELAKVDNRGYTTGFLLGTEGKNREEFKTSKAQSDWEFVGEVIKVKGNEVFIKVHNILPAGKIELVTPINCYKLNIKSLRNSKGELFKKAHGGTDEIFSFSIPSGYQPVAGSVLRRKK